MNSPGDRWLRRAAGREPAPAALELEPAQPDGDLGVGRGGSAAARPPAPMTSQEMSARLRSAARLARGLAAPGGVHLDGLDLDDLYR
jgi:hypothetical protein